MNFFSEKNIIRYFLLLAIIFLVLAIAGGVNSFSPVPYWDMWNGYLDFYTKVSTGDASVWWAQHNEHRIVLARALFFLDISLFDGEVWFLIVVNYLLIILVSILFYFILKETCTDKNNFIRKILIFLIICMMFSWIQKENFIWGFQSQFILAQLLPLLSFYLLHRSFVSDNSSTFLFVLSCFIGIMSLGSMANGVMTLPFMTLFAIILQLSWQRISMLVILAITTVTLYFYDYQSVGHHGSIIDALHTNPIGLVQYLLLYIGGPFFYLKVLGSQLLAQLMGGFMITSSIFFAWKSLKNPAQSSLSLVLLFFILYIGGTAFGTAGGRLIFGIEQAISSRYQTPALMAWSALLVLYAPIISRMSEKYSKKTLLFFLVIPLLLLPVQRNALVSQQGILFERWVAALALELNIKDQSQILLVFPSAELALSMVKIPVENNISIFSHPLISNVNKQVGKIVDKNVENACQGSLDKIISIGSTEKYIKIQGWLYQQKLGIVPESIMILDSAHKVVGYALTGQLRNDVSKQIGKNAKWSGFKGYVLKEQLGQKLRLLGDKPDCKLDVNVPQPMLYVLNNVESDIGNEDLINELKIQDNNWTGVDWYSIYSGASTKPALKIIGSFSSSDAESGSLIVSMNKGDRIWYRTEPKAKKQTIEILGVDGFVTNMPTTSDWVLLEFSNESLPDKFDVKFTDGGGGWGEWSAIAVKKL